MSDYTGSHRIVETTAETQRINVSEHNAPQHRLETYSKRTTIAFVIAFMGLAFGWALFGIPSAVATAMGAKALKESEGNNLLAKVTICMGGLGMLAGIVTAVIVMV